MVQMCPKNGQLLLGIEKNIKSFFKKSQWKSHPRKRTLGNLTCVFLEKYLHFLEIGGGCQAECKKCYTSFNIKWNICAVVKV